MNHIWTTLTFYQMPLAEWYRRSFLCRTIATLEPWQAGSWVLQWSDGLGAILVSLVLKTWLDCLVVWEALRPVRPRSNPMKS